MVEPPSSVKKNVSIQLSAPGKVILHGEHSVVYEKLALAASLGMSTRLDFCEVDGDVSRPACVTLDLPALHLSHVYSLQDVKELLNTPLPLLKSPSSFNFTTPDHVDHERLVGIADKFVKEHTGMHSLDSKQHQALLAFFYLYLGIMGSADSEVKPFSLKIETDLTVSAGTGSSASFLVCTAGCFVQYIRMKRCPSKDIYKVAKFHDVDLRSFEKNDLELICKWAFQGEKIIHGTPSGVDNTICTYGSLVEFRRGQTPKLVELSTKFHVILINTHVSRDTKALVEKVAILRKKHRSIVDGILDLMDEIAVNALVTIKKISQRMGDDFGIMDQYTNLGEWAELNHNLLRGLGVSHPKLDEACQILSEYGLHGKLTGAGGGGYAIALVPPSIPRSSVDEAVDKLKSRGFTANFTDLGGKGLSIRN